MERRSFLQWLGVAAPAAKVVNLYPEKDVTDKIVESVSSPDPKSIFHIYRYYNMGPSRWTELDNPHEYQHQFEFMDYDEDEDW